MLSKVLAAVLGNRYWVLGAFGLLVLIGLDAARRLPVDAVPDVTNVQVIVNVKTGALDPGKIERLVTYPIETELAGLPGVDEVRSLSKYGLAQVTVVFEDGTDVYFARQIVSERLQGVRAGLPGHLSPELAPVTTALGEVLMYLVDAKPGTALAARPEKERLLYLKEVEDYVLRPALKKVPGIAEVDGNGGLTRQIHINVAPERLERYGLSLEKFVAKIDTLGESFGGGYIQRDGTQLIVRATGRISELDTIAEIPLGLNVRGTPILIRDVAEVRADHQQRIGAATHAGRETVLGTVLMRAGANSRAVAAAAEEALRTDIQVPDDVAVSIVYSRSHLVNATVRTIARSLIEGAVLVTVLLLLLLGNWRAALMVASAIPLSMLFALKGMQLFGVSANLMSLGAIDFGLLVDGSVVLIENVVTRFAARAGRPVTREEKMKLVLAASEEVLGPLVFGLAIIMVVFVPILFLEGVEGKMFHPMALTILMALAGSLCVALFLMPVLAYLLLPLGTAPHAEPAVTRALGRRFAPLLDACRQRRWLVPVAVALPTVAALALFGRLGSDFVPQLDEGDLVINVTRDQRQDIDTSVAWQIELERAIGDFAEVETVFSRLGTSESGLDPMSPAFVDTFVILKKDPSARPLVNGRRRTKTELFEAIKARLLAINPAQELAATQPIEMRFNEVLEGSRADVSLRILGPDLDRLLTYTGQAEGLLKGLRGVASLESDPLTALTKSPVLDVTLNYGRMARYGVSLREVNEAVEAAMSGREVGSFYREDRRFPVLVHLDERLRNDIRNVARIPVGLADGGTVPLSAVTDIATHEQVTTVARTGSRRYSALSIFLKGRDLGGFVAEAQAKIAAGLKLDPGYQITWGGQFKNLRRARERLMIIIPLTLLIIFALLLRGLGSFRQAALVFMAIPFAMIGGVFALWLRGISLSVSAAIGFIALAGIATLNSMVLVTFFNQARAAGRDLVEAVTLGAAQRLRPVLTTALVASLGFVPMALNTGTGAEVQRPLATVVIGGVITSTLLTLIVIPVLYEWIERRAGRRSDLNPKQV